MEYGINRIVRVVWICHYFSREILSRFENSTYQEMAPWLIGLARLLARGEDIDLHIIMPNSLTNGNEFWRENNISFHLYKFGFPFRSQRRYNLNLFFPGGNRVRHIVDRIKPDIIHLHGAENAYYSSAVLPLLKRFPVLVTIQGFVGLTSQKGGMKELVRRRRIRVERRIFRRARHFGIRNHFMIDLIRAHNPGAIFHWHNYPINIPPDENGANPSRPEYDCAFFARVTKEKGIEDFLAAIASMKTAKPDIRAIVIGAAHPAYHQKLVRYCRERGIANNVLFRGNLPQVEAFHEVAKAKISVLPTYNDIVPGTVIECMFQKMAVIAYATGGLPEINEDAEGIALVRKGDVRALADRIRFLLENDHERIALGERARQAALKRYDNGLIVPALLDAYRKIIEERSFAAGGL